MRAAIILHPSLWACSFEHKRSPALSLCLGNCSDRSPRCAEKFICPNLNTPDYCPTLDELSSSLLSAAVERLFRRALNSTRYCLALAGLTSFLPSLNHLVILTTRNWMSWASPQSQHAMRYRSILGDTQSDHPLEPSFSIRIRGILPNFGPAWSLQEPLHIGHALSFRIRHRGRRHHCRSFYCKASTHASFGKPELDT